MVCEPADGFCLMQRDKICSSRCLLRPQSKMVSDLCFVVRENNYPPVCALKSLIAFAVLVRSFSGLFVWLPLPELMKSVRFGSLVTWGPVDGRPKAR